MRRVSIAKMLLNERGNACGVFVAGITEQRCDLKCRCALDRLAASDGKRAGLISPGHAPCRLRDVETHPLRRAERLIAKLRIANASISYCDEHLPRDPKNVKSMMWKRSCVGHGLGPFAPSKDQGHDPPGRFSNQRSEPSCAQRRRQAL
jgi:hypothetical protein